MAWTGNRKSRDARGIVGDWSLGFCTQHHQTNVMTLLEAESKGKRVG